MLSRSFVNKRLLIYICVALVTASLGIALTIWLASRHHVGRAVVANAPIRTSDDDRDDAIELVFRDLIHRYPTRPVYFLSFCETDPGAKFMERFQADHRFKKLSQAVRNANQVIDPESGSIGVHVTSCFYKPVNENEVKVSAVWEFVQPSGKDPGWIFWDVEYQLRRLNGKWVIRSSRLVPPLH